MGDDVSRREPGYYEQVPLNLMNRFPLFTFLAALFAHVLSGHATVLLDDTWLDGTRTETNLPEESAWFASTASSLAAATNLMTGTIPTTSSRHWWTYFTSSGNSPATLNIGETLRVTHSTPDAQ